MGKASSKKQAVDSKTTDTKKSKTRKKTPKSTGSLIVYKGYLCI